MLAMCVMMIGPSSGSCARHCVGAAYCFQCVSTITCCQLEAAGLCRHERGAAACVAFSHFSLSPYATGKQLNRLLSFLVSGIFASLSNLHLHSDLSQSPFPASTQYQSSILRGPCAQEHATESQHKSAGGLSHWQNQTTSGRFL